MVLRHLRNFNEKRKSGRRGQYLMLRLENDAGVFVHITTKCGAEEDKEK